MRIKRMSIKNFKSFSNKPTEIELDRYPLVIVRGRNGAGKTTMADALVFALTGTNPSGKLEELVNRVSGKNMEVVLEFEKGGDTYTIVRGLKPSVFEFYKNGTPVKAPSGSKNLQEIVESVTGIRRKGYAGLLFVNSDIFAKNFATMPAPEKRKFLETLIGGDVFERLEALVSSKKRNAENAVKRAEKAKASYEAFILSERELSETRKKIGESETRLRKIVETLRNSDAVKAEKNKKRMEELEKREKEALLLKERMKGFSDAAGIDKETLAETIKELGSSENVEKELEKARKAAELLSATEKEIANVERKKSLVEQRGKELKASLGECEKAEERLVSKYRICVGCPKLNILIENEKKETAAGKNDIENRLEALRKEYLALRAKENLLEKRVAETARLAEKERILSAAAEYAKLQERLSRVALSPEEAKELEDLRKTKEFFLETERMKREAKLTLDLLEELNRRMELHARSSRRVRRYEKFSACAEKFARDAGLILKEVRNPTTRIRMFKKYVPYVVSEAERVLSAFGSDLSVRIEGDGGVSVYRRFKDVPVTSLSKGESLKVNLAVSIAFSNLYEKRFGTVANVMIIDEVDGILDAESFSSFIDILESLGKNVFLITHRTDWEDYVDRPIPVMEVTKERFTKISFDERSKGQPWT